MCISYMISALLFVLPLVLEFESIRYKGKRGYIAVKKTGEDIDRERRSGALGL